MNRTNTIVIVVVAILVVVGGIVFATHKSASPAASTSPAANSNAAATTPPASGSSPAPATSASSDASADVTLHYTASGFSPASITVPAGHKFIVKNDSSATIQVDSDPHPQHTDNTQLNIGAIAPGSTGSATLTRTGTWGIHNHLNPSMRGTVVVQ
jgi:plastocyanin